MLAGRALRVDALDGSEAALVSAERFLDCNPRVKLLKARVPDQLPRGRWQRILVSEILYYLSPAEIAVLAARSLTPPQPGGELVAVHHVVPFDDSRTPPPRAVALFHRRLAYRLCALPRRRFGRYVVARWRLRREGRLTAIRPFKFSGKRSGGCTHPWPTALDQTVVRRRRERPLGPDCVSSSILQRTAGLGRRRRPGSILLQ